MKQPDFKKAELIPAIIQDAATRQVLMLGYMNQEAFEKTIVDKKITFFSRSKNRLWTKGETSKHFLLMVDYHLDCDSDTLLFQVKPLGPVCHTGTDTCWGFKNQSTDFLQQLSYIIKERNLGYEGKSYTRDLLQSGIPKIAQKVGEEAVETIIEALKNDKERLQEESADLLYHLLVLLEASGSSLDEVCAILQKRHQT